MLPNMKELGQMGLTFMLVLAGWIVFRAESLTQAAGYLRGICDESLFTLPKNLHLGPSPRDMAFDLLFVGIMLVVEWVQRRRGHGLESIQNKMTRWFLYCTLCILLLLFAGRVETFIYFQF
jgi:hypothetical protein